MFGTSGPDQGAECSREFIAQVMNPECGASLIRISTPQHTTQGHEDICAILAPQLHAKGFDPYHDTVIRHEGSASERPPPGVWSKRLNPGVAQKPCGLHPDGCCTRRRNRPPPCLAEARARGGADGTGREAPPLPRGWTGGRGRCMGTPYLGRSSAPVSERSRLDA